MPTKTYYEKHRLKCLLRSRKWYRENKEWHRAYCRKWRDQNKEKAKFLWKKWDKENPQKAKQMRKAVRFKRRKFGNLNIATIQQVYESNIKQYNTLTCELCNKPILFGDDSIDHKIPLSKGGNHNSENLCVAHRSCNSKKHTKTLEEWRKTQQS